jgi:hypothetical protein
MTVSVACRRYSSRAGAPFPASTSAAVTRSRCICAANSPAAPPSATSRRVWSARRAADAAPAVLNPASARTATIGSARITASLARIRRSRRRHRRRADPGTVREAEAVTASPPIGEMTEVRLGVYANS